MGNACASFLQDAGETSGAEGAGVVGLKFTHSLTPRPWTLWGQNGTMFTIRRADVGVLGVCAITRILRGYFIFWEIM